MKGGKQCPSAVGPALWVHELLFSKVRRLFCTPEDAFGWLCLFMCCPFGDRLTGPR